MSLKESQGAVSFEPRLGILEDEVVRNAEQCGRWPWVERQWLGALCTKATAGA